MNTIKKSPFQPRTPVKPEFFEGRANLIEEYLMFLNQSTYGNPQHFFINGKRGMGKSSFADYLIYCAKNSFNMIGIHVYNTGIHSLNDLINNIVESILVEIKPETWSDKIFDAYNKYIESIGFRVNIKKAIAENIKNTFPYFLMDILYAAKNKNGILIVIDDINGLSETPDFVNWYKRFAETLSSDFRSNAPVNIMLTSYPEKIVELYNHNPSFNRIFRHREIKPLKRNEVEHFFVKMFNEVDIKIDDDALNSMVHFSSGFPTMMQEIGDAIFWINDEKCISQRTALLGIIRAGSEIGVKYLKPALDNSIRSEKYLSIFNKLGQDFLDNANEDYSFSKQDFISVLSANEEKVFNDFLRRARELRILEFNGAKRSGNYRFTNNLYPIYFAIKYLEESESF